MVEAEFSYEGKEEQARPFNSQYMSNPIEKSDEEV